MELRQLKYFVKAAQTLHFSRAADELGIAQPALSRQIKLLEAELGCALFDRSNKWKLELTDAGKSFLDDSLKIVDAADTARKRARPASKGDSGSLSMSIIPSFFCSEKFFETLNAMRSKYPNVFLKLSKHSSANILSSVENGLVDFGIIRVSNTSALGTQFVEIGREKILLAVSKKNRLAARKKISMSDLKGEKFIMLPREESPFFRQLIDVAFKRVGIFEPNVAEEIYNFDAILKSLPNSKLVSFVPELLKSQNYYDGVVLKHISDLDADVRYVGVWRKGAISKPLQNFIKILRDKFDI